MLNQVKKIVLLAGIISSSAVLAGEITLQGRLEIGDVRDVLILKDKMITLDVTTYDFEDEATTYEGMDVEVIGEMEGETLVITKKLENTQGHLFDSGDDVVKRLSKKNLSESFSAKNDHSVSELLKSFIQKYENLIEDKDDLRIYLDKAIGSQDAACKKVKTSNNLSCSVSYLQDRWNGTMRVILVVDENDRVVKFKNLRFSGNH